MANIVWKPRVLYEFGTKRNPNSIKCMCCGNILQKSPHKTMQPYCSECNALLGDWMNYCGKCGAKINGDKRDN